MEKKKADDVDTKVKSDAECAEKAKKAADEVIKKQDSKHKDENEKKDKAARDALDKAKAKEDAATRKEADALKKEQ